jgi:hypothetical protein
VVLIRLEAGWVRLSLIGFPLKISYGVIGETDMSSCHSLEDWDSKPHVAKLWFHLGLSCFSWTQGLSYGNTNCEFVFVPSSPLAFKSLLQKRICLGKLTNNFLFIYFYSNGEFYNSLR